jgi:hypothetical protein
MAAEGRCKLCGAVPPDNADAQECDVCGGELSTAQDSALEKAVVAARVRTGGQFSLSSNPPHKHPLATMGGGGQVVHWPACNYC